MANCTLDILLQVEDALQSALNLIDEHRLEGFADLHIQYAIDIVQEQMRTLQQPA